MKKIINILIAEDHAVVREGLQTLLSADPMFKVVAVAANGRQAVQMTEKLRPEVVLMDIAMPCLNGLEATRQILGLKLGTKVLILSAHNDPAYVEHFQAAGAAGYLLKQTSFKELARAVHEVATGKSFFCPSPETRIHKTNIERRSPTKTLTAREKEVLQLIAEGHMNKQMAVELGISIKTVEKHRQNVMNKLNIHETAGLTRFAITCGIIEGNVQLTILGEQVP